MKYQAIPDDFMDIRTGDYFTCHANPKIKDRSYTYDLWRCISRNETHIRALKLRANGETNRGSLGGESIIPCDSTRRKFVIANEMMAGVAEHEMG